MGNKFCEGPVFNWTQLWETNPSVMSDCFQKSLLLLPTVSFLLISLWIHCFHEGEVQQHNSRRPHLPSTMFVHTPKSSTFLKVRMLLLSVWCILIVIKWILHSTNVVNNTSSTHLVWAAILSCAAVDAGLTWRNFTSWHSSSVTTTQITFYTLFLCLFLPTFYEDVRGQASSWFSLTVDSLLMVSTVVNMIACTMLSPLKAMSYNPRECPELFAEMPSKATFWWLNDIIYKSRRKKLTVEDVFDLRTSEEIKVTYGKFQKEWNAAVEGRNREEQEQSQSPPGRRGDGESVPLLSTSVRMKTYQKPISLKWVLVRAFAPDLVVGWVYLLINLVLQFANPFLLQILLQYVGDVESPPWNGYILGVVFLMVGCICGIVYQRNNFCGFNAALRMQNALVGAVYRKAMSLSNEARHRFSVGEVVNLMSVDVDRLQSFVPNIYIFWSSPLQIIICIILLWQQLGAAMLAGLAALVIYMPVNGFIINITQKEDGIQMEWKGRRLKLLHDILNGIRVLKLYAWELSFQKKINDLRRQELKCLRNINLSWMVVNIVWDLAPYIVMLVSLLAFMYTGDGNNVLTPTVAFVSLTLFNMLRFPMILLPSMMSFAVNALVSARRVQAFLNDEEISYEGFLRKREKDPNQLAVEVSNGTFSWKKPSEETGLMDRPVLHNICLEVPHGKLVAVVGKIGTGKSSLLSAIIGEMRLLGGHVSTNGTIAYVPQTPWIQHMTVKENILFSAEEDREWFNKVVDGCCLRPDLALLPKGENSEIGERGLNLSGGQKQRVSLARAVYQKSDVYLLDDPLSAVDANVGNYLFEHVIGPGGLLKNTTRILVTHSLQHLPLVDEVVVLGANGYVTEKGTYNELMENGKAFAELVREMRAHKEKSAHDARDKEVVYSASDSEVTARPSQFRSKSEKPLSRTISKETHINEDQIGGEVYEEDTDEFVESGNVSYRMYLKYIASRGIAITSAAVVGYLLFSVANVMSGIWIQQFTEDPLLSNVTTNYYPPSIYQDVIKVTDYYMLGYGLFGIIQFLSAGMFATSQALGSVRAAKVFHSGLLVRILRAPLMFFDTTPNGRIVNRFSKDVDVIDTSIPGHWNDSFQTFFTVAAACGVVVYTTPIFIVALVPLVLIYIFIQTFYIPVSRQSRRLASITRSPIFTHFAQSLSGLPVIRAFDQVNHFIDTNDYHVNQNAIFTFLKTSSNRWLDFRLQFLGSIVTFFAVVFAVANRNSLSAGLVGLSISYALTVTDNLRWMVLQASELETDAVSIERLFEYSNVVQESEWENASVKLPENWPHAGEVQFNEYRCRYRNGLPLVLKDLQVHIRAGEKIGIVGRTGAGKSSLTLALFRLIEAAQGHILIDGVNVSQLGLHQLRSRITILPQEPVLFNGTLRDNIDPFHRHRDDELWQILRMAHLEEWARGLHLALEYECGEGGQNLSVGQRQLICLARALLRKSRVLVLDEATAAVDQQTDRLLMETIFQQFQDSTIIIIAHRINTILNTDRIIVMSEGRVIEFAPPYHLMADPQSHFHHMAREAGLVAANSS